MPGNCCGRGTDGKPEKRGRKSVGVNTDWSRLQMEQKYKKGCVCVCECTREYVGEHTHAETKHFNPN